MKLHKLFSNEFLQEIDDFKGGAYCSSYVDNEVDTPIHQHNKAQFIYTEQGTLHIQTNRFQYFLPHQHFLWLAPNTPHRIYTNNSKITLVTIYFDIEKYTNPFYSQTGIFSLTPLLYEMIKQTRNWKGFSEIRESAFSLFLRSFFHLLPEFSKQQFPGTPELIHSIDKRLEGVATYLREHLHEKISLPILAREFGYSTRSLSRLFQQSGIRFSSYLQSLRIIHAMELLSENENDINTISFKVGYESTSSFSTIFLRYTGLRPSEYQKRRQS